MFVKDEKNFKGDIEIVYIGLCLGEKFYEELLIGGDNVIKIVYLCIMIVEEEYLLFE